MEGGFARMRRVLIFKKKTDNNDGDDGFEVEQVLLQFL